MNKMVDLILSHRSIRKFKSDSIDDQLITELVQAGQAGSSSSFIQAYSVIDITDAELRAALSLCAGNQKYVDEAPRFLVFCGDMRRLAECAELHNKDAKMGYTEQLLTSSIDAAILAQNLVVAAESFGLGAVYIGAIRNNPEEVVKLLKLPQQVVPLFGLCLGYPDQSPDQKPRLPTEVILHQNYYDTERFQQHQAAYEQETSEYYERRTKGRTSTGWSEQMANKIAQESRPHMLEFLQSQGFAKR